MSTAFLFAFVALLVAVAAQDDQGDQASTSCGFEFTKETLNKQIYETLRKKMSTGYRFGTTEFEPLSPLFRKVVIETTGDPRYIIKNYNVYGLEKFEDHNCRAEAVPTGGTRVKCKLGFKSLSLMTQDFRVSGEYNGIRLSEAGSLTIDLKDVEMEMILFLQSCTNAIILQGNANKLVTYSGLSFDTSDLDANDEDTLDLALNDNMPRILAPELEQVAKAFFNVLIKQFEQILQSSYGKCGINVNSKTVQPNCKAFPTGFQA